MNSTTSNPPKTTPSSSILKKILLATLFIYGTVYSLCSLVAEYHYQKKDYYSAIKFSNDAGDFFPPYRYYGSIYGIRALEAFSTKYDTIDTFTDYYIVPPQNSYLKDPLFLTDKKILDVLLMYYKEYQFFSHSLEFKYLTLLFNFEFSKSIYWEHRNTLYKNYKHLSSAHPEKLITFMHMLEVGSDMKNYFYTPLKEYITHKPKNKNYQLERNYKNNINGCIDIYNKRVLEAYQVPYFFNHLELGLSTARTIYYVDSAIEKYPELSQHFYPKFTETKQLLKYISENLTQEKKNRPQLEKALIYINGCLN